MKRLALLMIVGVLLVLSAFSLSSCGEEKVTVKFLGYYKGGVEAFYEDGNSVIRFYKDPSFEYDVVDFEKVVIRFDQTDKKGKTEVKYKETAYPPENARGNDSLQYFEVVLENEKIALGYPIVCNSAKGVLIDEKGEEVKDERGVPSVFMTFMVGLVGTVIAGGVAIFGLQLWDDIQGRFVVVAANFMPVCFNIGIYFWWGVGRGIIISFFCVAILAITVAASRYIDC